MQGAINRYKKRDTRSESPKTSHLNTQQTNFKPRKSTRSLVLTASKSSGSGWVTKRDRHSQIIKTESYVARSLQHVNAIEATRLKKRQEKLKKEIDGLERLAASHRSRQISIDGIAFVVDSRGRKLRRVDFDNPKPTPARVLISGLAFQRSKKGHLWRLGMAKSSK
jgi:hypothetical protein